MADEEPAVFFSGDNLYIKGCNGKVATIYGTNGIELFSGTVDDNFSIRAANKGIYIIKVGNKSIKAIH